MISVCMASYNGAKWIALQIDSILPQLGPDDELIVVDDASCDTTLDIVRAYGDSRIRVFENEQNLGVDLTFERALTLARGDILFLTDQDDIWYPDKVSRVMRAFEENPNVTLVLSDAHIIDSDGKVSDETYFEDRGDFIPGVVSNIMKSKFLGCSMVMKSTMKDRFYPFQRKFRDMICGLV